MKNIPVEERLIVALDSSSLDEARQLIGQLDGVVSFFKIGLVMQLSVGLAFVQELIKNGKKVFLDYKHLAIEETIERAVPEVSASGVKFLTVHGNGPTIKAAVEGRGKNDLKILSVTVLTSLDDHDLKDLGYPCTVSQLVLKRAQKALEAGADGVIASGLEAPSIREIAGDRLIIVTPGIRPEGSARDDQKRKVTPDQAIKAGADYLVVGRPITQAPNPRDAAMKILDEMQSALNRR
jgi:orotidine-5'-phosphate decarboxylase